MRTHKALLAALLVPLGATLALAPAASAAVAPASAATPPAPAAASVPADAPAATPIAPLGGPQKPKPTPAAFRSPEAALDRVAHPLRTTEPRGSLTDLRPFGRMVGDAKVVGVGEATHNSHEFFTVKHRVLRYLVEKKGFRAFALEASWSSGLRLDAYITRGEGDLKQIMDEEFQGSYQFWNTAEYRDLIQWMRAYNIKHPKDPVRFVGDDNGFAGGELYDKVGAYAAAARPDLSAKLTELYRGLRPTTDASTYVEDYLSKPLAEREELAERTGRALALLKQRPGKGTDADAQTWAVQHATAIHQMTTMYAFDWDDPQDVTAAMRYRDQVMAQNVAWWQRQTGDKILLSAHNSHVALKTYVPNTHPKVQGDFLREQMGRDYVSVGLTFDQGSFNALGQDGAVHRFAVGPSAPGTTEHTLDRVRHRDFMVDLRTAPAPARAWLAAPRTVKNIGATYPWNGNAAQIRLTQTHDILIHLHQVEAADMLK
ncbi:MULTISPECIES: erythromycin esterase family protein [Streptomyces]|nr:MULTISPECIES: erythromycin esterase family protein [unclassified Streptomyces]MYY80122.1 erythromycin esterase family protein [Streptomyces sp. SID335]NDZ85338.1 erythromycin esterase family protein [Streptomyces sp. SID10115]NEB46552.1 erythromycin esterase family protein [Streptomyces sp. SID339]